MSTFVVVRSSLNARRTQQHDEGLTGTPTDLPDEGAQHAATSDAGALFCPLRASPNTGMSFSVRYDSHAMPCGSTVQYLFDFA